MFGKRKKELKEVRNRLDKIEGLIVAKAEAPAVPGTEEMVEMSPEKKLKAAYALNLCTVSVSQIVDYSDLYILEQEYDGILNNLNLENIPHDEELLDILKRLLDTITFFRIQEGDKRFIEEDYQQKTKSAIWSALPNLSVILATGNPVAMAVSLASQVGIGYMNYRKEKAKLAREHEKELWQLQRAAIEQFNALRRELFATAWKLADRYQFADNYRLTERQISQYNEVLMDPDPVRRYERLNNMADAFVAYPNFHFYIGDAANDVAKDDKRSPTVCSAYRAKAIKHLRDFNKLTNESILRIDPITSAACLELVDLLDPVTDTDEIMTCLRKAVEKAGNSMDIIQLCAIGFLRINAYAEAEKYLRLLSVEGYNQNVNASLLSMLYFRDYQSADSFGRNEVESLHESLSWVAPSAVLIPLPENTTEDGLEKAKGIYLVEKSNVLLRATMDLLDRIIEKQTVEFNRAYLNIGGDDQSDGFYMNSEKWYKQLDSVLDKKKKKSAFLRSFLQDEKQDFFVNLLNRVNLIHELLSFPFLSPTEGIDQTMFIFYENYGSENCPGDKDIDFINQKLSGLRDDYRTLISKISSDDIDEIGIGDLVKFTLPEVLRPEFSVVIENRTKRYLGRIAMNPDAVKGFNQYENELLRISKEQEVVVSFDKASVPVVSIPEVGPFALLGADLYDNKSMMVRACIKDWFDNLADEERGQGKIIISGSQEFSDKWNELTKRKYKTIGDPILLYSLHAIILAATDESDAEMYLTTESYYCWKVPHWGRSSTLVERVYSGFDSVKENEIKGYYVFRNGLNINSLFATISKKLESFRKEGK